MYSENIDWFTYFPLGVWLMQMLFILFPTLLYQSFFKKKLQSETQRKLWLVLLYALSIIFCMAFPVSMSEGFILDFRYIPLILGFLYGGYQVGIPLLGFTLIFRFLIGGQGFYLTVGICLALLVILYFTLAKFAKYDTFGKRIYSLSVLIFTIVLFGLGALYFDDLSISVNEILLWLLFGSLNIITLMATIYIHESMLELEKINYEIIDYEKMHNFSQFSISIAHKLQAPVENTQKKMELLKSMDLPNNAWAIMNEMDHELKKAANIIEDYLIFTNEHESQEMLLDVHSEFNYILQSIQPYAQMNEIEIKFYPAVDRNFYVKGNRNQFRHALLNIIKNGIEASQGHGVVEIATHEMLESVYIIIEDDGKGMSDEEISRIGKPVNSKKKNGTGIGTLVAFNILRSMSGKIEVTSQIGKGTTFSIILPKAIH